MSSYMNIRCFLPLLAALLLNGCRTGSSGPEAARLIRMDRTEEQTARAALNVDGFVKLQTPDEAVVGEIVKVIPSGDYLYVLTAAPRNEVFLFTAEGCLLRKIPKGRANNEIIYPTDISVDEASGNLYVLDNYRTVKEFTAEGVFRRSDTFREPQFFLEHTGSGDRLIFYNQNARHADGGSKCSVKSMSRGKMQGIYRNGAAFDGAFNPGYLTKFDRDSLLVCPIFSDTIYLYAAGRLAPCFVFDFAGKSANTPQRLQNFRDFFDYASATRSGAFCSGARFVTFIGGKMVFALGGREWFVYEQHTGRLTAHEHLFDDLPDLYAKIGQDSRRAIYAYDIAHLLGHFERHPPQTDMGRRIAAVCTDEEENPILVFATIQAGIPE